MAKSKSSMNFVPVILIFVLILSAGYLLLKDNLNLPWFENDNTIEITRMEGFPRGWETPNDIKKTRKVIKNDTELREFLQYADINDQNTYDSLARNINFDKEYFLGVTSDTQEETESQIRIKRVEIDKVKKQLQVRIIQSKPDVTCVPEVKKNVLVDIVKIDKSDNDIDFDVVTQTRSCD